MQELTLYLRLFRLIKKVNTYKIGHYNPSVRIIDLVSLFYKTFTNICYLIFILVYIYRDY